MQRDTPGRYAFAQYVSYTVSALGSGVVGIWLNTLHRAWVFAAALIVGLRLFANHTNSIEVTRAFEGAVAVLGHFSTRSQQSAHYHTILTHMRLDIDRHQQDLASSERQSSSRLVSRIFSMPPQTSQTSDQSVTISLTSSQPGEVETSSVIESDGQTAPISSLKDYQWLTPTNAPTLLGLDGLASYPWDDFSVPEQGGSV
jgi:hypothetical protein